MTGEYIRNLIRIVAVCFPFYCISRILWVKRWSVRLGLKRKPQDAKLCPGRELALAAFSLFMAALLVLTFQKSYGLWDGEAPLQRAWLRIQNLEGINIVPFRTIGTYFAHGRMDSFLLNIVGNIVMFLPWGFGLPLLWKSNQFLGKIWSRLLLLPVFIEAIQLFTGRSVDIDDIILNFIGGFLGTLLYFGLRKLAPGISRLAR